MTKKFNVVQVGFGPMGQRITKLLLKRKNLNLLGVVDIAPNLKGKTIKEILDIPKIPEIIIESDLDALLAKEKADVVIIGTSSFFESIIPTITTSLNAKANVISLCEQLSFPFEFHQELTTKVDEMAKEKGLTVVGSGINPGYLMDLLPIVLTAPCETVEKIHVTRMMNSSKRRIPFQKKIGTNLTVEEFNKKIRDKEITGHVGLEESIQMIVAALGFEIDEIVEYPPKAILAEKEMDSILGKIPKGNVRGLHSKGIAKKDGEEVIILDFYAYAGNHEEYDSIEIDGIPGIKQKIQGGVHGDIGTASMIVNLIPRVVAAKPGLLTMKDLPVPFYTAEVKKD
jgi:4-hydroxy-tetrahydrodipicolinate reductase